MREQQPKKYYIKYYKCAACGDRRKEFVFARCPACGVSCEYIEPVIGMKRNKRKIAV